MSLLTSGRDEGKDRGAQNDVAAPLASSYSTARQPCSAGAGGRHGAGAAAATPPPAGRGRVPCGRGRKDRCRRSCRGGSPRALPLPPPSTEARRVGKESVSPLISRLAPYHQQQKNK